MTEAGPTQPTSDDAVLKTSGAVAAPNTSLGVGRDVFTTFIGNLFPPASALATAPILAHSLGVEGRGVVAAAMGPYLLLTAVAALGIPEAVTYAIARHPWAALRTTRRGLMVVGFLGVTTMAGVVALGNWLSGENVNTRKLILVASFAIVPALCLGVVRGTASGLHLWRLVAKERLITAAARLIAIAGLAISGTLTPMSATIVMASAPVAGALAYVSLPGHMANRRFPGPSQSNERTPIVRYGLKVWIGAVSGVLLMRVDQALMTPLAGTFELGLYVIAATVSEIPLVVNSAFRDVIFASEAKARSASRLTAAARISSSVCLAVGLLLIALVPVGIPLLFGKEFAAATPAAIVLILAVVIGTPGSVAGAGLSGRGRPGLRSASLTVGCAINLVMLLILVPEHGAIGAAWATLVGNMISANLAILFMRVYYYVPVKSFFGIRRSDIDVLRVQARSLSGPMISSFRSVSPS